MKLEYLKGPSFPPGKLPTPTQILPVVLRPQKVIGLWSRTPWYLGWCGVCRQTRVPAARLLCHALPSREHTGLEHVKSRSEQSVQSERRGGGRRRHETHPVTHLPVWAGSRAWAGGGGGAGAATRRWRPQTLSWDDLGRWMWVEGAGAWYSNSPEWGSVGQAGSACGRAWGEVEEGAGRVLKVQTRCAAAQRATHVVHVELDLPCQVSAGSWCAGLVLFLALILTFLLRQWLCCQQGQRVVAHLDACAFHSLSGALLAHAAVVGALFNTFLMKFVSFVRAETGGRGRLV